MSLQERANLLEPYKNQTFSFDDISVIFLNSMIVHFIASKGKIGQEIEHYRDILAAIKKLGHTLALDWVEETHSQGVVDEERVNWTDIEQENTGAISKADVIIVEATQKTFFVGYRVAQAIQQKKPILILTRDNSFPGITGLSATSDLVTGAQYNKENLVAKLKKFFEDNDIPTKDMRFNFFIDRPIYNYLRWAAYKTGKTKAEILRDLVSKEIDNANKINNL